MATGVMCIIKLWPVIDRLSVISAIQFKTIIHNDQRFQNDQMICKSGSNFIPQHAENEILTVKTFSISMRTNIIFCILFKHDGFSIINELSTIISKIFENENVKIINYYLIYFLDKENF